MEDISLKIMGKGKKSCTRPYAAAFSSGLFFLLSDSQSSTPFSFHHFVSIWASLPCCRTCCDELFQPSWPNQFPLSRTVAGFDSSCQTSFSQPHERGLKVIYLHTSSLCMSLSFPTLAHRSSS